MLLLVSQFSAFHSRLLESTCRVGRRGLVRHGRLQREAARKTEVCEATAAVVAPPCRGSGSLQLRVQRAHGCVVAAGTDRRGHRGQVLQPRVGRAAETAATTARLNLLHERVGEERVVWVVHAAEIRQIDT
jgi:hypothetical protein